MQTEDLPFEQIEAEALERFRASLLSAMDGRSQRSVEEAAGLSTGALSHILNDEASSGPSFRTIVRLSAVLSADLFAALTSAD